jgi:cytoskeletal protein CcmA (bactofilin family)
VRWHRRDQTGPEGPVAFITEGSTLVGTCSFSGSVVIAGHVKGEIRATVALTVARAGRVEARLHAPIVIIEGQVVGSITASERIELRQHARVQGDLETPALVIEEQAVFEGKTKPVRGQAASGRGDGVIDMTNRVSEATT